METEAPCSTWRRTSGAAPDAVKAARPVLNGGREETCRKVTRLAPTQLKVTQRKRLTRWSQKAQDKTRAAIGLTRRHRHETRWIASP